MRIIPVLDLKGGVVVRARLGQRDQYRPIETPLSPSPDPVAVARGLRTLHPFPTFYVADLDAIAGGAPDATALADLDALSPPPKLWIDAGTADRARFDALAARPSRAVVLGSESQRDATLLAELRDRPEVVLSLDFFGDVFRGPAAILDDTDLWPARIIVMTLGKVGSGAGPDVDRLRQILGRAGGRQVFAAGGVRDASDIALLAEMGVAGALVATALHDGRLSMEDLAGL